MRPPAMLTDKLAVLHCLLAALATAIPSAAINCEGSHSVRLLIFISLQYGYFWYIGYFWKFEKSACWSKMAQVGPRWHKLVQDGTSWSKMAQVGPRWRKLVQDGASLSMMAQVGTRWLKMPGVYNGYDIGFLKRPRSHRYLWRSRLYLKWSQHCLRKFHCFLKRSHSSIEEIPSITEEIP